MTNEFYSMKTVDFDRILDSAKLARSEGDITKSYGKWFDQLILRYMNYCGWPNARYREFLERSVFFQTITFDQAAIRFRKAELGLNPSSTAVEMDDFHLSYVWTCEQLYGKRWSRKVLQYVIPMAIVAIDYEGLRYASKLEGIGKNAHLHNIWVTHPDKAEEFQDLVLGPKFRAQIMNRISADKSQLLPYEAEKATIRQLGTYAAKVLNRTSYDPIGNEELRIYPNRNYGSEPYRASATYTNQNWWLNKLRVAAARDAKYLRHSNEGRLGHADI